MRVAGIVGCSRRTASRSVTFGSNDWYVSSPGVAAPHAEVGLRASLLRAHREPGRAGSHTAPLLDPLAAAFAAGIPRMLRLDVAARGRERRPPDTPAPPRPPPPAAPPDTRGRAAPPASRRRTPSPATPHATDRPPRRARDPAPLARPPLAPGRADATADANPGGDVGRMRRVQRRSSVPLHHLRQRLRLRPRHTPQLQRIRERPRTTRHQHRRVRQPQFREVLRRHKRRHEIEPCARAPAPPTPGDAAPPT